jgi:hypothetical protein
LLPAPVVELPPIVLFKLRALRRNSADWIVPHIQSWLRRLLRVDTTVGRSLSRMAIHGVMDYSRNGQAMVFGWKRDPTKNQTKTIISEDSSPCLSGNEH